jgi:hypothetical protein
MHQATRHFLPDLQGMTPNNGGTDPIFRRSGYFAPGGAPRSTLSHLFVSKAGNQVALLLHREFGAFRFWLLVPCAALAFDASQN